MVYYLITREGRFAFEFDQTKSAANKEKHGIDFIEAQQLWADEDRITASARPRFEERLLVVGLFEKKCWTAVITYRGTHIRLVSVRRARPEEEREHGKAREGGQGDDQR